MKALVTGGAGFIGSNLVRLLVEKKHSVTVLDNLSTGHLSNLGPFPSVKFIKGDIRDERTISRALRGVDIVFHLAASVGNSLSIKAPVYDSETNVLGTLKLLRAAHQNHIKKIVYSSSAGILGTQRTAHQRKPMTIPFRRMASVNWRLKKCAWFTIVYTA